MELSIKDALYFLLEKKYFSEFEIIDGISQHTEGLTFDEWLLFNKLLIRKKINNE